MPTNRKAFGVKIFISMAMLFSTLHSTELDWLHDYEKALAQAKKDKKDVYLFIGADVCKFCERYKKNTLSDKSVLKRLKKDYVLVYMSRDQHKVPSQFEVKGVPRHYFISSEGKLIYETRGRYRNRRFLYHAGRGRT